jgi:uncharacterized protein
MTGLVLDRPRAVLLLLGVLTLIAGVLASRVEVDSSIEVWFSSEDRTLADYRDFLDLFPGEQVNVVAVFPDSGDVFQPPMLALLDRLTHQLGRVAHADRARSITTMDVLSGEPGLVEIGPLVPELPQTDAAAAAVRKRAMADPLVRGTMITTDGRAALIAVELAADATDYDEKFAFVDGIDAVLSEHKGRGATFAVAGPSTIDTALSRTNAQDNRTVGVVSGVVTLLLAFLLLRGIPQAIVPLTVVGVASLWSLGLVVAMGSKLSMLATALFTVVLAVGMATSVHVVSEWEKNLREGASPRDAMGAALRELLVPCGFTTATTAAGFLSLRVSELQPIQEFGMLSALGAVLAFALCFTLLPAGLLALPSPAPASLGGRGDDWIARMVATLRLLRRDRLVLFGFAAAVGMSAWGATGLPVGPSALDYFRDSSKVRQDTKRIEQHFSGATSLQILARAPNEGFLEPGVLGRLEAVQALMEDTPGFDHAPSVLDAMKAASAALYGSEDKRVLPDSRPLAAQIALVLEGGEEFRREMLDSYSLTRLRIPASLSGYRQVASVLPEIQSQLARRSDENLQLSATGRLLLVVQSGNYLVNSQLRSTALAFAMILLMLGVLLRSAKLAAYAMITNVGPVVLGLGLMAVFDIAIDPGTVMVGCITLGLVVDDTVHFLVRYQRRRAVGEPVSAAVQSTLDHVGRPILITSLVLCGSFGTLIAGQFVPLSNLGIIASAIVLLALLANLIVLPAALRLLDR